MLKLYKNKKCQFECKLEVDGASYTTVKPRLIFYPSNDPRNLFFEGTIFGNTCTVNITPNVNINATGRVVLEVIVDDSTIFRPWQSEYEILTERARVSEESISMTMDDITPKVKVVDDVKVNDKVIEPITASKKLETQIKQSNDQIVKEQTMQESVASYMKKNWANDSRELVKLAAEKYKLKMNDSWKIYREVKSIMKDIIKENMPKKNKELFVENCNIKDKKHVNEYLIAVKKLPDAQRKALIKHIDEEYKPRRESLRWAQSIFSNADSISSKISMYCRELK